MDEDLEQNQTEQSLGDVAHTVSDGAKKIGHKAKEAGHKAKEAIGGATKKLTRKVASGVAKGAAKVMTNPIFLKILLIGGIILLALILLIALIAAIAYVVTGSDFDAEKGLLSSMFGISGDKFYGARFIYEDDQAANLEIKEDYLKFTYSILNDTSSTTGLSITLSANYLTDANVIEIATNFANDVINNVDAPLTLEQCIIKIDHFGFSDEEITIVFDSIAETLIDKSWAAVNEDTIISALDTAYQLPAYSSYTQVMPKLYVWDYVFEKESSTLDKLPKKDYCGMIYMPKESVTIESATYMFVVEGGYGVDVCLKQNTGSNIVPLGEVVNANASWYYDNHMQEYYECNTKANLNQFEAINTGDLSELSDAISISSLYEKGLFDTYFDVTDGDYSETSLLENVASNNYVFLELVNKDEHGSSFNFAEHIVSYK